MRRIETWDAKARVVSDEDVLAFYRRPCAFQVELARLIEEQCADAASVGVIEVGSSFGVTTALLPPAKFHKTILDLSSQALERAGALFERIGQRVSIIHGDALALSALEGGYDVAFSAGLAEHFPPAQRSALIAGMAHITKPGGVVVLAVPNHDSLPYRVGYLLRVATGRWRYPRERRIGSAVFEARAVPELVLEREAVLDKENIYHFLSRRLARVFRLMDRWMAWEGYLKVFVFRRRVPDGEGVRP